MTKSAIPHRTASELLELSMAVPQVISHRLARMALSGPVLSPRDQREFTRMVVEKEVAFSQAWLTMGAEMFKYSANPFCWPPPPGSRRRLSGRRPSKNPYAASTLRRGF